MCGRIVMIVALGVLLCAAPAPASAQPADLAAARGTVYRMNDASAYVEGCFPPCLCPIWFAQGPRGTFVLRPAGVSGNVFNYAVDDVNWYVGEGDSEMRITGSGRYQRISGTAGWSHRLQLELSIDGGPVMRYDSGSVDGGDEFPDISGITVARNGFYCYDVAITVDASPVPADEIVCYRLGRESSYEEGCQEPCACPVSVAPLGGGFALVELRDLGTYIEYAVVRADWRVIAPYEPPSTTFRGFGRYTRISGFAGWLHRMEVDLRVDGGPLTAFDSGLVNGGGEFPAIDIAVAMNGFYCYDIVLRLQAKPCRPSSVTWTGE